MGRDIAVEKVELLESCEVLLCVSPTDTSGFEFIYRAAAGVHWDNELCGFRSENRENWSVPAWVAHIRNAVADELGVRLRLDKQVQWFNVSTRDREEVLEQNAI
jgi:hypothetical protein